MNRFNKTVAYAAIAGLLAACSAHVGPKMPDAKLNPAPSQSNIQPILGDSVPATQPAPAQSALPPGHPDLSQLEQQGGGQSLPPGHPQLPAQDGQGALPPGHPQVGAISGPASTQPSVQGTLTIHAVQKTPGAAPAGADSIVLELYFNGQLWDQTTSQLTPDGTLKIVGLPVKFGIQPVVKVTHAGVVYTASGDLMDAQHPDQNIEVPVYETVDKAPDWSILMRHVIVHPVASGIEVTEMLAIECPGDRAWLGNADAAGKRTTLALALPDGAKDFKVGGALEPDGVTLENGILKSNQAITPGESKYQLQYTIPAIAGKLSLSVIAPVKMGHVLIFYPDDGTTLTPAAPLQLMGSQQMGENGPKTRYFMATQIDAGQKLTLDISDFAAPRALDTTTQPSVDAPQAVAPDTASGAPKAVAMIGIASVLVIGTVVMFVKGPRSAAAKKK